MQPVSMVLITGFTRSGLQRVLRVQLRSSSSAFFDQSANRGLLNLRGISNSRAVMSSSTENVATTRFREYLRIKTVHPNPDYAAAKEWLTAYGKEVGLEVWYIELAPGKPFVVLTQRGVLDKSAGAVVLYSHIDVVPVFPEHWKHDPFGAHKDEHGNIYGRGAQDMKCVGIQYVEALRRMKQSGVTPFQRTVHVLFGPDEEIGAVDGAKALVKHADFKKLNAEFMLDEGIASPEKHFLIFYGERNPWWLKVICHGQPGHGSIFLKNTAPEKLRKVIDRFSDFRAQQEEKLKNDANLTIGDVISVNLTKVEGGVQQNVVPEQMCAYFDIRVPPTTDFQAFTQQILDWLAECGDNIDVQWLQKCEVSAITELNGTNMFWRAMADSLHEMNIEYKTGIFVGATDSRFVREAGVDCLNFSPMNDTPVLLHDHNEFLSESVFLRGIEIYETILKRLLNVPVKK